MNKEDYDQHFMIDNNLIQRIIEYSDLNEIDVILEIGPGKGILTKELIKYSKVLAIELDIELYKFLRADINSNNLKLLQGNILNKIQYLAFDKIVSNIPYSISEPLIKKIMITQPKLVVLCTGKNLTKYLENNYLLNIIYDYELLEIVPKTAFNPQPNIESAIIKLHLKDDEVALFFRDLLKQYDKKLKNALIKHFEGKLTKNEIRTKIKNYKFVDKSLLSISVEEIKKIKKIYG